MIHLIYQIKRTHWLIIDLHLPWLVPLAGMVPIKNPLETHSRLRDDGWKRAQGGIERHRLNANMIGMFPVGAAVSQVAVPRFRVLQASITEPNAAGLWPS